MVDRGNFNKTWKSTFSYVDERVKAHALVDAKLQLPDDFQPSEFSVLCGRGRECYNHSGNRRFRDIAAKHAQRYSQAKTKMGKSIIVMDVIDAVRDKATVGGFVKKDSKTGIWIDIGDDAAREKVGQQFRAALGIGRGRGRNKALKLKKDNFLKQQTALVLETKTKTTKNASLATSQASTASFQIDCNATTGMIIEPPTSCTIMNRPLRAVSATTTNITGTSSSSSHSIRQHLLVAKNDLFLIAPQDEEEMTSSSNYCSFTESSSPSFEPLPMSKQCSTIHNDDLYEASKLLLEDIPSDEEFFQSFNIYDPEPIHGALIIDDFEPLPI